MTSKSFDYPIVDARLRAIENPQGLGEPLPGGIGARVRVRATRRRVRRRGQHARQVRWTLPVELDLAQCARSCALDIDVDDQLAETALSDCCADRADVELRVLNAKGVPVTLEVRQGSIRRSTASLHREGASHRAGRKFGDFAWRLRVPANGDATLTYRLEDRSPKTV